MTVATTVRALPRTIVSTYLRAARLPLAAAERVARQQDNDEWPPSLAFETFEAGVETVAGSLLHDEQLLDIGRARQAKVAKLREAAQLETVAQLKKQQAADSQQERKAEIAEQRKQTHNNAQQRKNDLERQAEVRERKAEHKAASKTAEARQQKAAQDKVMDRQDRAAKTAALSAEARALQIAKDAVDADETVDVIDSSLEATKQARTTS